MQSIIDRELSHLVEDLARATAEWEQAASKLTDPA